MKSSSNGGKWVLKKRFANRPDWKRVSERRFAIMEVSEKDFEGTVTLLKMGKVTEPLIVRYDEQEVCIVDHGYSWLQHFPVGKPYTLTTVFNEKGEIVQWYIDICRNIEKNKEIPYWLGMFLDIVILPSGEIFLLDEEELEEALEERVISKDQYDAAKQEATKLMELIKEEKFSLLFIAHKHKKDLENLLEEVIT